MRRLALHLLLVFTLILNGISAPSAMSRMSHGEKGAAATPAAHVDADEHAHHGHAAMEKAADVAPADHGVPDADHGRGCCDGASCACGCVMPPALSFFTRVPAPLLHAPMTFVSPPVHAVAGHDTPPFRPPAA
jgi:hypothetical protein